MVPKLRFKEFCGEWEEKRLGDVFKFMHTNSFSRNDLNYIEGDIYNVHYGDIHMIYPTITDAQKETFPYINREKRLDVCSEILCKDGDVLLADASEDYDDIGKAIEIINVGDKKIVSGLHTIFMRDYKKIYANKFRGFMMNSNSVRKQIKVLAAGAKVLGISKFNITKVKIPLPSLPEQTKIADFLSTVDDKIQNQQDKITHLENIKNGFMQKIFSRKIRFKDDGGEEFPEWEEKKLGDFLIKYDEITVKNNQYPPITSSRRGIFLQKYYFNNRQIASEDNTGYNIVPFGYFTYRHMSDDAVFYFNINNLVEYGIVSTLYPVFTTTKKMNSIFLQYYLNESTTFKKYCILQKQGGSRTYMYFNKLKQFIMENPCLKEQQKIADFLSLFDEKISTEKETLEHLEQLKKGLLQQMFV